MRFFIGIGAKGGRINHPFWGN